MIVGQILVYRFNGLHNAVPGVDRNIFELRDVSASAEFKEMIHDALDEVPPGRGYVMIKWNKRVFICEKDPNDPSIDYVRHEIKFHPLMNQFSI